MTKGSHAQGTLIGRMGKELQTRDLQSGKQVGSFSIACTSGWGDRETTSWFNVSVFDERKIKLLKEWGGKGKLVLAIGELVTRKFTHNGVDREATELVVGFEGTIQLIGSKKDNDEAGRSTERNDKQWSPKDDGRGANREDRQEPSGSDRGAGAWGDDLDDEVPFD